MSVPVPPRAINVHALLRCFSGEEFRDTETLIQLPASTSVVDALRILGDANITGAPVYEEIVTGGVYSHPVSVHSRKYIGFVDASDLAMLVITKGLRRPPAGGFIARVGSLFSTDTEHQVVGAVNLTKYNPFIGLPLTGTLAQAAHAFSQGLHRVAIVDASHDSRVVGVVTSSSVVRIISENLSVVGPLADTPVGRLVETGPDVVTCVPEGSTARLCFVTLLSNNCRGMPIVDADGAVVANFSATDINRLADMTYEEAEAALDESVFSYLKREAPGSTGSTGGHRAPLTLLAGDTLGAAIELLVAAKVHRVYVVDGHRRPIGVVSLTDVINILNEPAITAYDAPVTPEASTPPAAADVDAAFVALLKRVTARELVNFECSRGIVDIGVAAPLSAALMSLTDHTPAGVVVFRENPQTPFVGMYSSGAFIPVLEKTYIGYLTPKDIVSALLRLGLKDPSSCFDFCSTDSVHTVASVIETPGREPFWAVPTARTLDQLMRLLRRGVHQLAVVDIDAHKRFVGMVTQSDVIAFLEKHKDALGPLAAVTLSCIADPEPRKHVVACTRDNSARTAFERMVAHNVSGLPVLDSVDGDIVSSISLCDVRLLAHCKSNADVDRMLAMDVMAFLQLRKRSSEEDDTPTLSPLVLHGEDSLGTAIELLAASRA